MKIRWLFALELFALGYTNNSPFFFFFCWGIPIIHHSFSSSVELSVELLLSYLRSRSGSSAFEDICVKDTTNLNWCQLVKNFPIKKRTDYIILNSDYFRFDLLRILYVELIFGEGTSYCVLES